MIVCPCCGLKFEGDLRVGCPGCKSQSVGEPLSKPEIELPFYGRSIFLGALGSLMALTFFAGTFLAWIERGVLKLEFWTVMEAAETASWRLKFTAIPVCIFALWGGGLIYRHMTQARHKYAGFRIAQTGLALAFLVTVLIGTTIGITVPARLERRDDGINAGEEAKVWALRAANLKYRAEKGSFVGDSNDLKGMPDPDGTLALAISDKQLKTATYQARSDVAATLPQSKSNKLRGAVVRPSSGSADDSSPAGFAFTNYEERLPGPDKILGTDDDIIKVDGLDPADPHSSVNTSTSKP